MHPQSTGPIQDRRKPSCLDRLRAASLRFPQSNWSGFLGVMLTATFLWVIVLDVLVPRRGGWWAWFLIVALGALAALLTLAFAFGAGSVLGPARRTVVLLSPGELGALLDEIDKAGSEHQGTA